MKKRQRKEKRNGLGQILLERGMTEEGWRRKARESKEVMGGRVRQKTAPQKTREAVCQYMVLN